MQLNERREGAEKAWIKWLKDLESTVLEFNAMLGVYKLYPSNKKRANGVDYSLKLKSTAKRIDDILPLDATVRPYKH